MPSLVVCEACSRHIRRSEAACPFCGAAVSSDVARSPERALPTTRLGRAALFAFAAASVGAIGCGGTTDGTGSQKQPISDAAPGGASNGGASSGTGGEFMAMYGAPAMGGTTSSSGGTGNGMGGGAMAMYGAPFPPPPVDAGPDGKAEAGGAGGHENGAGGGFHTLYGMPAP